MSTLAQIWPSMMFANITLITHVSDIILDKAQLLYYITQEITMDIFELIAQEIHKFVISQVSARGTAKSLGFLSLIYELCKEFGVQVPNYPVSMINPLINKSYILTHYTNLDENQVPRGRIVMPRREKSIVESVIPDIQPLSRLEATLDHIQ